MSFLNWEGNLATHQRIRQQKNDEFKQWNSDAYVAPLYGGGGGGYIDESTGDFVDIVEESKVYKQRAIQSLKTLINKAGKDDSASPSSFSSSSAPSDQGTSTAFTKPVQAGTAASSSGSTASASSDTGTTVSSSSDKGSDEEEEEGEVTESEGLADVACEVDCVVYSWGFRELRELLVTSPGLGLVFERCISSDLNKKMSTNWSRDTALEKYKHILNTIISSSSHSLSSNPDGGSSHFITPKDRQILAEFRKVCIYIYIYCSIVYYVLCSVLEYYICISTIYTMECIRTIYTIFSICHVYYIVLVYIIYPLHMLYLYIILYYIIIYYTILCIGIYDNARIARASAA